MDLPRDAGETEFPLTRKLNTYTAEEISAEMARSKEKGFVLPLAQWF